MTKRHVYVEAQNQRCFLWAGLFIIWRHAFHTTNFHAHPINSSKIKMCVLNVYLYSLIVSCLYLVILLLSYLLYCNKNLTWNLSNIVPFIASVIGVILGMAWVLNKTLRPGNCIIYIYIYIYMCVCVCEYNFFFTNVTMKWPRHSFAAIWAVEEMQYIAYTSFPIAKH